MTGRQRTETALSGGRPDRVPVLPIYDIGYIMKRQGLCVRDFRTATPQQSIRQIVNGFGLHEVDGYFVHGISDNRFQERCTLEEIDTAGNFHIYRDRETRERFKMNPMGDRFAMDGTPRHMLESRFDSRVKSEADIRALVPKTLGPYYREDDGYYGALKQLSQAHPDRHFQFQIGTPFVFAMNHCGGYEAAMCMLLEEPELMKKLMQAVMELELQKLELGRAAGGRSILFTSYYTGADTISPKTYHDLILPFEIEMCRVAKQLGLYVVLWFLGDMNPLLPWFREIPFHALFPEQDRKGYGVDYRRLRSELPERCLCSFTFEDQFIRFDREGIRETFLTQFEKAGRDGAFIAGNTIMPEDADPRSMDFYVETVRERGCY